MFQLPKIAEITEALSEVWTAVRGVFVVAEAGAASPALGVLAVGDSVQPEVVHIRGEGKELDRIAKDLRIPREALRKAIEKIKKVGGLRGNQNVDILPDGTVVDPTSGDPIGNIRDEQGK